MHKILSFLLPLSFIINIAAQDKLTYLEENRKDLTDASYVFPQTDFNLIGFGALHGSAKTYDAELNLIKALKKQDLFEYYIIEANYSQAFYFQEYLDSGDEELLKELVISFQSMVSQEGTIETFNHWKNLRALSLKYPDKPIKVLGFDVVNEYKFAIKHILTLTRADESWSERDKLASLLEQDTLAFTLWTKEMNSFIKSFVVDYQINKNQYEHLINDQETFNFVIENINHNFEDTREREKIIYDNYMILHSKLGLQNKKQFAKYGYFHIQKHREGDYPSFFTRLIENNIYERDKVITTMVYLTKSKVLWDKIYDKKGNYKTYTTKGGYGISDYWREYFVGIKNLKQQSISDQTIYRLNRENTPYIEGTDLVEIKMFLKDYNTTKLKGKNTRQFIDYAILISNSPEQIPLEEIK